MTVFSIVLFSIFAIQAAFAGLYGFGHEFQPGYGYGANHGIEYGGDEDFFAPAGYQFEYGVHDPHSHDIKSQHEHRDHDNVKGSYFIDEPDGTKRVVDYISAPHAGFQAVVKRVGHAQHPAIYGKHAHGHGLGGTSYVGVTNWGHGSGR
ncbi:adult-specific cuticular protein ACP-20 [Dendroctonus ponderosae]|uniref:Cuticle protein n=1 Tax=Dendroctonus ponderosae TaxID=77166 RepID=A0AAR5PMU1_DENPD|nr:adult-specific cuticular protein ACP-20 [Dendroctonus ponderosae]